MRTIHKPEACISGHFRRCASATRNADLKARLLASEMSVIEENLAYDTAGLTPNFYSLHNSPAAAATDHELRELYKRCMVAARSAGRALYDQLRHAAEDGICPLCGQRPVATLDHYLPKEVYPKLSISPINLIPCCSDCNRKKHTFIPTTADNQLFHPYFDDHGDALWLHAQISYTDNTPFVSFRAQAPANWDPIRANRLVNHFDKFELSSLYSIYANTEISVAISSAARILTRGSPTDVRAHLREIWLSWRDVNQNSWQCAAYLAFFNDDHICSGVVGTP